MLRRFVGASTVAGCGVAWFVAKGGRGEGKPDGAVEALSILVRRSPLYVDACAFAAKQASEWLDAEVAHRVAIVACRAGLGPLYEARHAALETTVLGMTLESPVGVSAGFDKHGEALMAISDLGFGFVEVGGVTPVAQAGNPKPRVFRLRDDCAIVNRLGLNSDGVEAVAARLATFDESVQRATRGFGVGVNVASNTGGDDGAKRADFATVISQTAPFVDFFVLNISCPNVGDTARGASAAAYGPGGAVRLDVDAALKARAASANPATPLLVKISPDLDDAALRAVATLATQADIDGLVVANTTARRDDVALASPHASEKGGLSGAPLRAKALAATRRLYELTGGRLVIVGVGGIATAQDAYDRIRAGASLVELYTALAYQGPTLVPTLHAQLARLLAKDGFATVQQAVGADTALSSPSSSKKK